MVCIDLGCIGEEDIDLEGGKELRSGGAMAEWEISIKVRGVLVTLGQTRLRLVTCERMIRILISVLDPR